jgi:RNA polymerase sigma-70 factor (ECF subfamily)
MSGGLTKTDNSRHDPETWVDLYGDILYRFALSRVKDPSVAEDLVQETFLAALGAYRKFKGRSTLRTWLIAILKYKFVDYIRKKVREQGSDEIESSANVVDGNFNGQGTWRLRCYKWTNNPIMLYAQKEFMDTLYKCLAKLPGRLAEAFIMKEIDGLSTKKICEALNITAANCWVMLHRARRGLRPCTETCWLDVTE